MGMLGPESSIQTTTLRKTKGIEYSKNDYNEKTKQKQRNRKKEKKKKREKKRKK